MSTPPQSEQLVQIAEQSWTIGQTAEGEPYAIDADFLPGVTWPLRGGRGGSFRAQLADDYRRVHGKPPSSSALTDALAVLEGKALSEPRRHVSLRVARPAPERIVVDLGQTETSRCIVIEPGAWSVADRPPAGVLFRRTALTGALPTPVAPGAGDLGLLEELVNVPAEDWPLIEAVLVAALFEDIPHPILAQQAEQGAAKSTNARFITRTIDPSPAELRAAPKALEEWVVAASGSWLVCLDNLSNVPFWLQDALCRAGTGEGLVRRQLYTDSELAVLKFRRVVLTTGIDLGAIRGDLADRSIVIRPDRIDPTDRRLEADLEDNFAKSWPAILGGLYDLVGAVLSVLPGVTLANPPRMADFGRILAAVDVVTGSTGLARYAEHGDQLAEDVLESDEVAVAVRSLMENRDTWHGSATELLDRLRPDRASKSWPKTPHHLSGRIRRAAPALRNIAGIVVVAERGHEGRSVTIQRDARDAGDAESGLSSLHQEPKSLYRAPDFSVISVTSVTEPDETAADTVAEFLDAFPGATVEPDASVAGAHEPEAANSDPGPDPLPDHVLEQQWAEHRADDEAVA